MYQATSYQSASTGYQVGVSRAAQIYTGSIMIGAYRSFLGDTDWSYQAKALEEGESFTRTQEPFYLTLGKHYANTATKHHHNVHDTFLSPLRPTASFINTTTEIEQYVEETFTKITNEHFPTNISITICTTEELKTQYQGQWSEGIQGISINRQGKGKNDIYIKEGALDHLMLVIGHEIGHVMTPTLANKHDEEAKAFAFELAWMDTIIKHKIANLENAYYHSPAQNGLHDKAFTFVKGLIKEGKTALESFMTIIKGERSFTNTLEYALEQ